MYKFNTSGGETELSQHRPCWCPGSLRRRILGSHGITGPCLPWRITSTTCVIPILRNDRKWTYVLVIPKMDLKRQGLNIWDISFAGVHPINALRKITIMRTHNFSLDMPLTKQILCVWSHMGWGLLTVHLFISRLVIFLLLRNHMLRLSNYVHI